MWRIRAALFVFDTGNAPFLFWRKDDASGFFEELSTLMYPSALLHTFGVNGKISGSVGAIGEMQDVIPIIHGPKGCAFHYRYSARRRHQPFYNVISTDLKESDIVYGGEEKLRRTILEANAAYHPSLLMVIPSPVSDILGEDIHAVAEDLRVKQDIPVVAIGSELFSHRDKNYARNRLKELAGQKITGDNRLEMELKGCGFTEALYALVDQVMQPAEMVPYSVNIETVGWGSEGKQALVEIEHFLNRCGVSVNCWIPSAPLEKLVQAPRAQLNLVKRVRWARRMKERFGTDYLHIGGAGRYMGLDGICTFYRDIASVLGLEQKMENEIQIAREEALCLTEAARKKMGGLHCTLVSRSLQMAPFQLKLYAQDYGMYIDHICVILTPEMRRDMALTEELEQKLLSRVQNAAELYSKQTQLWINPEDEKLHELFSSVDAVVGTGDFTLEGKGAPLVPAMNENISLSFESYIRNINRMCERANTKKERPGLLLNRMNFVSRHYPLYCNRESLASREMWSRMWLHREEISR